MLNFEEIKQSPVTPSAISILGFCLVIDGVRRGVDTKLGIAEVCLGRSLDVVDGYVAKKHGLETKLGALIDAGLDKLGMAIILMAEHRKNIVPPIVTAGIVGQNLVNTYATYRAWENSPNEDLKPVNDGRLTMASQGFTLLSYALSDEVKDAYPDVASSLQRVGHLAAITGTGILGTRASSQYLHRAQELASI